MLRTSFQKQNSRQKAGAMCQQLYAFNLAGTQTAGANMNSFVCSLNNSTHFSNVGLPHSVCFTVGMGNIMTEHNALAADFTFSHFLPPFI
jgi:hypothetical protein